MILLSATSRNKIIHQVYCWFAEWLFQYCPLTFRVTLILRLCFIPRPSCWWYQLQMIICLLYQLPLWIKLQKNYIQIQWFNATYMFITFWAKFATFTMFMYFDIMPYSWFYLTRHHWGQKYCIHLFIFHTVLKWKINHISVHLFWRFI